MHCNLHNINKRSCLSLLKTLILSLYFLQQPPSFKCIQRSFSSRINVQTATQQHEMYKMHSTLNNGLHSFRLSYLPTTFHPRPLQRSTYLHVYVSLGSPTGLLSRVSILLLLLSTFFPLSLTNFCFPSFTQPLTWMSRKLKGVKPHIHRKDY